MASVFQKLCSCGALIAVLPLKVSRLSATVEAGQRFAPRGQEAPAASFFDEQAERA